MKPVDAIFLSFRVLTKNRAHDELKEIDLLGMLPEKAKT